MLWLIVDELNTGASLGAEMAVRRVFMERGAAHKVMSAGRDKKAMKKLGTSADERWRAAARAAGLSLDKASPAALGKKDLARADLIIALQAETADTLTEQGFAVERWLPTDGVWPATQESFEAFAARALSLLEER